MTDLFQPRCDRSPRVSVIVATRERPALLNAALASIARQVDVDFEVVVYDDGSCDKHRSEIVLPDGRFHLILESPSGSPGQGPGCARNRAIARAQGEFMAFLDDDDVWINSEHLKVATQALGVCPEIDLYAADQVAVEGDRMVLSTWWPRRRSVRCNEVICGVEKVSVEMALSWGYFPHLNTIVVRRRLIEAVGGFWERTPYEEDLDFAFRSFDRMDSIIVGTAVVARHNVPNKDLRLNVSTQLSQRERLLARAYVCRHVRSVARRGSILKRCNVIEGDTLRHLTFMLFAEGKERAALDFALQALATRCGVKWAGYVVLCAMQYGVKLVLREMHKHKL